METKLTLQAGEIFNTRCSLCDNFLSVPPIMVISEDGKQYKCGRCKSIKCNINVRIEVYENILKHLSFPCIYENCNETIPWGKVEEHENGCNYRTILCPLCSGNDAVIEVTKLADHFKCTHQGEIKYGNTLLYILKSNCGNVCLLVTDNELFFVHLFAHSSLFSVSIFSIEAAKEYDAYDVKVSNRIRLLNNNASISCENEPIKQYNERIDCFKCMGGNCYLKRHVYSKANTYQAYKEPTTKLDASSVTKLLNNPGWFIFNIKLLENPDYKEEHEDLTEDNISTTVCHNHNLIQKNFECPICQEFMVGPIHNCKTGHSLCGGCVQRLEKCPTCQAEFDGSRNYALEQIAENVSLSCQYEEQGCRFTGNVENICSHEVACSYREEN